jgi:2'-hydroxyisoflavone reductase
MQMPLWLHAADQALMTASIERALALGLTFRPLEDTARDTLAWEQTLPADARAASPALTPEREAQVLAAWQAVSRSTSSA